MSPIGSAGAKPSGARDEEEDSDGDLDSDEEEMLASYENESLTDMISARLESIIDRLYRLSFRIRSPATRLGVSKASRYRDVDESTNIDLMDMYAEVDRRHIRELLKQISGASADDGNDHYLVSRLSQANTLRRKQFGQWGRHRSKLKGSSQPKQAETLPKLTDGSNKPRALLLPGNKAPSRPSTATMIVDRHIDLDDNKSVISTSTYIQLHDADATGVFMPPPPTVPIYRKEFECPYCHILCSRKTLEKQAWEYVLLAR